MTEKVKSKAVEKYPVASFTELTYLNHSLDGLILFSQFEERFLKDLNRMGARSSFNSHLDRPFSWVGLYIPSKHYVRTAINKSGLETVAPIFIIK